MVVETRTVTGTIERGPATQRHFVRELCEELRGTGSEVLCPYRSGKVSVSAESEDIGTIIDVADEWDGEPSFRHFEESGYRYNTGRIPIDVSFKQ